MNKREIVDKLNTDLESANALAKIMAESENSEYLDVLNRLEATAGYIRNLLEYINLEKKC